MIEQGLIIVLCDNAHRCDPCIHHVGEREVDETISSAERNGRHRPVTGELRDIFIMNIGKNYAYGSHMLYSPL